MGWYIRKAFSTGPVRFNLSKSGLGMSFGVKGARVGVGPRGAYTHLGRGGLYYRSGYSGGRRVSAGQSASLHLASQDAGESIESRLVLYDDKQIHRKRLTLQLALQRKWIWKQKTLVTLAVISFLMGLPIGEAALILPSLLLAPVVWGAVAHRLRLSEAEQFHQSLVRKFIGRSDGSAQTLAGELKASLDSTKTQGKYRDFALTCFYRDYLEAVLADSKITDAEETSLAAVETVIGLSGDALKTLKRWVFNRAYLDVVEDKALSKEEEADIFRAQRVLGLSDDDVREELDTLNTLREVRKIQEEGLTPVAANIPLSKNEACYHKSRGRIVKEKVLRTYQSAGERHKVTDLAVEREGDLYLTSAKIALAGDGVYSVKLDNIFDVETDLDQNTVELSVEGRKTPLVLTVPDSYLFSAKLNKLLELRLSRQEQPA
jgi:hypothetical protein